MASQTKATQSSLAYRCLYSFSRLVTNVIAKLFFRIRVEGRDEMPTTGGGLICANHQSYLDPFFVGIACDRCVGFVARESLFRWPILRTLMRWYQTIPIRREGIGMSGIREILRRTKRGDLILIFPEGTRTHDGDVGALQAGFAVIAKRARVPIIPVGVDGAFNVWPRQRKLPRPARVAVCVGEPIDAEFAQALSDKELVDELTRRVVECHARARNSRQR